MQILYLLVNGNRRIVEIACWHRFKSGEVQVIRSFMDGNLGS
jgi:hypothetical protein